MQIYTIQHYNSSDFDKRVNEFLKVGLIPFGEPKIETVSYQDTWDDEIRVHTQTVYSLVMKKN